MSAHPSGKIGGKVLVSLLWNYLPRPPVYPGGAPSGKCQDALDLHNKLRAQHGAPPLTWDAKLAASAQVCWRAARLMGLGCGVQVLMGLGCGIWRVMGLGCGVQRLMGSGCGLQGLIGLGYGLQ